MTTTVAYLLARDTTGVRHPENDREARLLEALEDALRERIEAQADRDDAVEATGVAEGKLSEVESDLETARDELAQAEESLKEERKRADDAEEDAATLRGGADASLVDALDARRSAEARLARAQEENERLTLTITGLRRDLDIAHAEARGAAAAKKRAPRKK